MATETYKYNIPHKLRTELCQPQFIDTVYTTWDNFKTFTYKDDDVIICTYPRSGTHMVWLLTRYLLQGSTEPIKDPMEDSHLPPFKPNDKQKSRRVFNTHLAPANFGDEFFKTGKHKFIRVGRNPKDTLVSFFHVMSSFRMMMVNMPETWEEFVEFVLTTDIDEFNWFKQTRAWEEFMDKNPEAPILHLKFEDIVRDPEPAIKKMAKFLEVPLTDKLLQDIVVAGKFENMKDAPVTEELEKLLGSEFKDYKGYYRKGKIGDWVNTFTVAQNEMFDAAYKEQMEGSKVTNIYH